jgi:hypothetical protein
MEREGNVRHRDARARDAREPLEHLAGFVPDVPDGARHERERLTAVGARVDLDLGEQRTQRPERVVHDRLALSLSGVIGDDDARAPAPSFVALADARGAERAVRFGAEKSMTCERASVRAARAIEQERPAAAGERRRVAVE